MPYLIALIRWARILSAFPGKVFRIRFTIEIGAMSALLFSTYVMGSFCRTDLYAHNYLGEEYCAYLQNQLHHWNSGSGCLESALSERAYRVMLRRNLPANQR